MAEEKNEKSSKKEEFFKDLEKNLGIPKKELEDIYDKFEKQLKDKGKTYTEELIMNRMYGYLAPVQQSTATKHIAVFLGADDNYGLNKFTNTIKADSIKVMRENPEQALEDGYAEEQINQSTGEKTLVPLWHTVTNENVPEFKLGKKITDNDYSATAHLFVAAEDGNYVLKHMRCTGERRKQVMEKGHEWIGKEVSFLAIDKGETSLNDSKYTKFSLESTDEKPVTQLLAKHAKTNCLSLKNIDQFYQDNGSKLKTMPVFIRGTIANVIVSETSDNNIVSFRDYGYNGFFNIYIPKTLGIPPEGIPNTIFGGRIRKTTKDRPQQPYSMNGFMYYVPPDLRDLEIPDEIKKYRISEQDKTNTKEEQNLLQKESSNGEAQDDPF
jgi:hypothetical protein|tara:strand:- start:9587 stop:10732 length:1146 start_codon:yes stop_codon:yes gene_type:complete